MRKIMVTCAALLVMGGIVYVYHSRESPAEPELKAERLPPQVIDPGASSGTPPPATVTENVVSAAPTPAATESSASKPASPIESPQEWYGAYAIRAATSNLRIANREMLNDPEYRAAQLASLRKSLKEIHAGLAEELSLAPQEADDLFDLLAGNQLEISSLAPTMGPDGRPDQAAMARSQELSREAQGRHEQQVASMLGSRYPLWQAYQESYPARQQVTKLGRTLESAGLPLSDAQRRPLVAVYAAQGGNQLDDMGALVREAARSGPGSMARVMEQGLERQAEGNQRILEAASAHLSSGQLDVLRRELEQQLESARASVRAMRERGQSGR